MIETALYAERLVQSGQVGQDHPLFERCVFILNSFNQFDKGVVNDRPYCIIKKNNKRLLVQNKLPLLIINGMNY